MAKRKSTKEKQRSTKQQNITHKTKDRVIRTPVKIGGELKYTGRGAVPAQLVPPLVLQTQ